ncbi:MAG: hypothetical protein WC637_00290 [Victivallales bacterium]|jgi:hypothetical protein
MPVGDFKVDTFSDEEKAALGEAKAEKTTETKTEPVETEVKEGPETQTETTETKTETEVKTEPEVKTEQTAEPTAEEKEAAEDQGFQVVTDEKGRSYIVDEDGERIPPKRFKEIYREAKEGERIREKHNLLKQIGPEEFYRLYPDEKPAGYKPQEKQAAPIPKAASFQEIANLEVNDPTPGSPIHGKRLGELLSSDDEIERVAGHSLLAQYEQSQRDAENAEKQKKEAYAQEATSEFNAFCFSRAKEMLLDQAGQPKDPATYTPAELERVAAVGRKVLEWTLTPDPVTGRSRSHYTMADAYFLMNRDNIIKTEKTKAAKATLETITKPAVRSIGPGGGGTPTGFEAVEAMTESQLTDHIDKMSDSELKKFYRDAPKSLRDKHPSLPWG